MEEYAKGFGDGMREAALTLRGSADDHENLSKQSKKVLESHAHLLASALFRSWANGIEMNADGFGSVIERKPSVRPMNWVNEYNGDFTAETVVGEYHIGMPNMYWTLTLPSGEVLSGFNLVQAAQDLARADYESKIISALA